MTAAIAGAQVAGEMGKTARSLSWILELRRLSTPSYCPCNIFQHYLGGGTMHPISRISRARPRTKRVVPFSAVGTNVSSASSNSCILDTDLDIEAIVGNPDWIWLHNLSKFQKEIDWNSYQAGKLIDQRVFHLTGSQSRLILMKGDLACVNASRRKWTKGPSANNLLDLKKSTKNGMHIWKVSNKANQVIAFEYQVYQAGVLYGWGHNTIDPTDTQNIWADFVDTKPSVVVTATYLDPL